MSDDKDPREVSDKDLGDVAGGAPWDEGVAAGRLKARPTKDAWGTVLTDLKAAPKDPS